LADARVNGRKGIKDMFAGNEIQIAGSAHISNLFIFKEIYGRIFIRFRQQLRLK
jgi:hypothetical protein